MGFWVKKWKKGRRRKNGQKMDFGVSKYYITPIIRAFEWKNAHFSVKNPYFPFKNRDFKGGQEIVEKWPFLLFFNKNGDPYVIERPAVTASFSGGIDDLGGNGCNFDNVGSFIDFSHGASSVP